MSHDTYARSIFAGSFTLLLVLLAAPAAATPNMIRLGYPTCASCHVNPQGAGLLTSYGEGIDLSQTLKPDEPDEPEFGDGLGSRTNYDVRLTFDVDRDPPDNAGYGFNLSFRSAVGILPQHRLVYTAGIRTPTLQRTRTSGTISTSMSRLYWLYQPKVGLTFVVGRDDLPSGSGTGAQGFFRPVTNPNVSSTPTQAKVFWWNNRWQVAAYGYGPDGNETERRFEARGGGAMVGVNVWKDRAVVGLQTRVSRADAFDRDNAAVFARIGLSRHWGVLLEHDITERTTDRGENFTHLAGHTQVFFVPFDWLQTAIAAEHRTTRDGASTYRLTPSADVRLTQNIKLGFSVQDVHPVDAPPTMTKSRTWAFDVQVKTQ